MLTRAEDWSARLAEQTARAFYKPFAWGQHDCALFAADCIDAMTDARIAQRYRGTYKTAAQAKRITGPDLECFVELMAAEHHLREVPVLEAQRGDVAVFDSAHGPTLGVVVGRHIAAPGPQYLVLELITRGRRAWRVG